MLLAIAWCIAWGDQLEPLSEFEDLRTAIQTASKADTLAPLEVSLSPQSQKIVEQVRSLQGIDQNSLDVDYPRTLDEVKQRFPQLYGEATPIGLVLGGATKIKQYVFETANLQDIRGASALLDRINLVDLKSFFDSTIESTVRPWFVDTFPQLAKALIPELIIYSTGGNILAFCPPAHVHKLADAIEQCYTRETLTANSAAVGDAFKLLELRLGHLHPPWLQDYLKHKDNPILQAYFEQPELDQAAEQVHNDGEQDNKTPTDADYIRQFSNRKSFSELVTHLAIRFNQRRSGNHLPNRDQTRAYPPMFETHGYLHRDDSDRRSSTVRIKGRIPDNPKFSEPSARKYFMGQKAKRDDPKDWWKEAIGNWQTGDVESWVQRFLKAFPCDRDVAEARSLPEIAAASSPSGYVAYIYADGNNMGGYIQNCIQTPEAYQQFSEDVFYATEQSVYRAIAQHIEPTWYKPTDRSSRQREGLIYPFEILTIGGDDVLLIVPGDKGLAVAKTLSETFETILQDRNLVYRQTQTYNADEVHRYRAPDPSQQQINHASQCQLSMSAGVLITAENTPIYYADRLVSQLLKSAKRKAKALKKKGYLGGTIDFLTLKSVTMISSNIDEFRAQGLTHDRPDHPKLKLYSAPYTLHEIGGLLETAQVLKNSKFPPSQLYQIRSLLEDGKKTAMLNYRYFRARLKEGDGTSLDQHFDRAWCWAKSNGGTLAPWRNGGDRTYETIWRELIDLYAFMADSNAPRKGRSPTPPNKQPPSNRPSNNSPSNSSPLDNRPSNNSSPKKRPSPKRPA